MLTWKAIYDDGFLAQYNGEETNQYADIERDKLKYFEIYNGDNLVVRYHFDTPDKRLIFRRRTFNTNGVLTVYHLVGWQRKIGDTNVQSISVIGPNGIDVIDGWKDDALFSKPIIHTQEGEDWE